MRRMYFEDKSLCSVCQQVDWKDLVERPLNSGRALNNYNLERYVRAQKQSRNELKYSKCRCCQILSTSATELDGGDSASTFRFSHTLQVTTLESQVSLHPPKFLQRSLALLQITRYHTSRQGYKKPYKRYIALFGPGKDPAPSRIPLFIEDFTWIRDAILECCQQHEICLSKQSLFVPGLLVIDCLAEPSTISLVSAPKACQYAALSYVWGGVHTTSTEVPAVIKDAIKVTVKLGLRFLWTDRYCIPQNDSDKHRLIHSMDKIYSKAYITIVAAAGKTAADGLPGISTIPRRAQMETEISGCTFLELPSILDSTRASTRAQRGWTYQEGLLSTRCLVFTERGVLYHCRGRYSEEPVQQLIPQNAAAFMSHCDLLKTLFAPYLAFNTELGFA